MRVFLTGATGFVGPAVVRAVVAAGHEATVLVHKDPGPFSHHVDGVETMRGDVTELASFRDHVHGHDAVVHLVALRRAPGGDESAFERMHVDATRNALAAADAAGARRFLHTSASGVRPDGTAYQRTKWRAEELVKASGLDWTIFRPTFVTGPAEENGLGFDHEFADIVRKTPLLPSFAGGDFVIQPVAKKDLALAYARALTTPQAAGKTYVLAGPDRLEWDEYLRALARTMGRRRALAPMPRWLILPVAGALGRFPWFPASRDELEMLFEGAEGDSSEAAEDLDIEWTPHRVMLEEALGVAGEAQAPAR